MEIRVEQLVLLGLVILAALIDYIARSRRNARTEATGHVEGADPVFVEEADADVLEMEGIDSELPLPEPYREEIVLVPSQPVPPRPANQQHPPPQRVAARPPPTRERVRHPRHHWLGSTSDARRGIVLMTILGPCRGLENR